MSATSNLENAGQVLLWPYLERYFASLDMLCDGEFVDVGTANRAALLIEGLVREASGLQEQGLSLNKVLCGLPSEQVLVVADQVTEREQSLGEDLLSAVTQNWPPLSNTPIAGLRELFLQREGRLERVESGWLLEVEKGPYDMLLDQLPWQLSVIRLSWMIDVLHVKWRSS